MSGCCEDIYIEYLQTKNMPIVLRKYEGEKKIEWSQYSNLSMMCDVIKISSHIINYSESVVCHFFSFFLQVQIVTSSRLFVFVYSVFRRTNLVHNWF